MQQVSPSGCKRRCWLSFWSALLGCCLGIGGSLNAQQVVQGMSTSIVSTGSGTVRTNAITASTGSNITVTYNGDEMRIDSLTVTGGTTYTPTLGGQAFARRNTGTASFPAPNANQTTAWNTTVPGTSTNPPTAPTTNSSRTVNGVYHNTMETLFTSQNLHTGTENLFVNTASPGDVVSNVERMDFVFSGGVVVTNDMGFAVFERGGTPGAGGSGGFKVALITGIDTGSPTFVPTAFANTVITMAPGSLLADLGNRPLTPAARYDVYRYETAGGPDLDYLHNANISAQVIYGAVFSPTDFGVALGSTFYGYAVFGLDVTATNGAQVLDWTNATYFPTNSPISNDMDMVATGATLFIPEPSTVLLLTGSLCGILFFRRRA